MKLKKVLSKNKFKQHQKKKFIIKAHHKKEVDIEIEVMEDGDYVIEKLSVDDLPDSIEGHKITWLNNFGIKKGKNYINQHYKVRIPGLSKGRVVIIDNNSEGKPYFFTGTVENDTISLSDGDPAIGHT
ncbi:MAG: hypothetical protein B6243_08585 [Anaerolineaceae bacterium 4572_5.2]|nr:MAG: hypothetical protein B6243_08585 [Anaerolineaceae bacterium 4572_5.2]